jgi:TolB-like protein/Flp pilus assembly protein TadD
MSLRAGTRLGPYRIEGLLGAGGMGEVYRAHDTRLGRDVAVKILHAGLGGDPTLKQRFEREARAISQLEHERVCRLYDVGREGAVDFLVMELLDGETLADRLRRGPLAIAELLEIGGQIASALAAAHAKAIAHRDLKPGNVMLTPAGVKVLDFGLAKEVRSGNFDPDTQAATATQPLTRAGLLVGTLPYMAPEQLQSKTTDSRSDIWALGCVLYEMATGVPPFRGESQVDLIAAILGGALEPPTRKQPLAPARLDAVVARCLERDPNRRWHSARDVAIELEDLAKQAESSAPASSPRPSVPAPARPETFPAKSRLRLWAPALCVVLASLVAVAIWLATRSNAAGDGRAAAGGGEAAPSTPADRPMMVVLPFENLGPPEQAYFAAGMSEAITSRLARVAELGVISRSSALQYAGGAKSVRQMGEELGVDWVLDGTVLWAGDRVRINQQLIRVTDDTQVWNADYDRVVDVENLIDVQAEIAEQVSRQLGLSLFQSAQATRSSLPTASMDAYHAYLRGVEALERPFARHENLLLAEESFATAVKLDPAFALAWAKLIEPRVWLFSTARTPEREADARATAERARELAPELPETHRGWGLYHYIVHRNFDEGYREYEMAAASLPNDSGLQGSMGHLLLYKGDFARAAEHYGKAADLDPRDFWAPFWLGLIASRMRQYAKADQTLERAIAIGPNVSFGYIARASNMALWRGWEAADRVALLGTKETAETYWRWRVALRLGRYDDALELAALLPPEGDNSERDARPRALLRAWTLAESGDAAAARASFEEARAFLEPRVIERPQDDRLASALGLVYAGLARKDEAIRFGERGRATRPMAKDAYQAGPFRMLDLAAIYATVGEADAALDLLDELLSKPSPLSVVMMESDPAYEPLRGHPRYRRLVEQYR